MDKQKVQDTVAPIEKDEEKDEEKDAIVEDEKEEIRDEEKVAEEITTKDEEYVGEEEQEINDTENDSAQSDEEKAIQLVKKEWGEDNSVTFNIENTNGTKYYVAVKSNGATVAWYEVDIQNWEVSEF